MLVALGGLALFLYGLGLVSSHLQALAGPGLNRVLRFARRAPVVGVLAGTGITAVAQSATAVGLMTISFADAGLLGVREAVAVMLGGAIGGTLAVQLASFRVFALAFPLIVLGYALTFFKGLSAKNAGGAILGLGLAFLGLETMIQSLQPVRDAPLVREIIQALSSYPVALVVIGAVLTLVVHSSNAPAVLAIALVQSGAMTLEAGLALVIGANLGTPANVYLLSSGRGIVSRRATIGHLALKFVAAAIVPFALGPITNALRALGGDAAREIANAHTLFNVACALVFLPGLGLLERVLTRLMPDPPDQSTRPRYLDETALETPSLAYSLAFREVTRIADHVLEMVRAAFTAITTDRGAVNRARSEEEIVDTLVHAVVLYLARLSETLPGAQVQPLLAICSSLEAIGDLLKRMLRQDEKLIAKGLRLSPEGKKEVGEVAAKTLERARLALTAFSVGDTSACRSIAADRDGLQAFIEASRAAHLARLRSHRDETELTSSVHLDTLTIFEQINAELTNVAQNAAKLEAKVA